MFFLICFQNTAIQDRPKAKPVSKKEGKNGRKLLAAQQVLLEQQTSHSNQNGQRQTKVSNYCNFILK